MEIDDNATTLNAAQIQSLEQILEACETKLGEAGKVNATQAFNLGCIIGVVPAGIIILIAYIATRSWLAALSTGILMMIALVGLANLAAITARAKAMERVYKTEASSDIARALQEAQISTDQFNQYAWENLPETAYTRHFIPQAAQEPARPKHFKIQFPFQKQK